MPRKLRRGHDPEHADQLSRDQRRRAAIGARRDHDEPGHGRCRGEHSVRRHAGHPSSPAVPRDPGDRLPGGVPTDPPPEVHSVANSVVAVEVVGADRWDVTAHVSLTTVQPITVSGFGADCALTIDTSAGSISDLGVTAQLQFLSHPDPAGPKNYISVGTWRLRDSRLRIFNSPEGWSAHSEVSASASRSISSRRQSSASWEEESAAIPKAIRTSSAQRSSKPGPVARGHIPRDVSRTSSPHGGLGRGRLARQRGAHDLSKSGRVDRRRKHRH